MEVSYIDVMYYALAMHFTKLLIWFFLIADNQKDHSGVTMRVTEKP